MRLSPDKEIGGRASLGGDKTHFDPRQGKETADVQR